MRKPSILLFCFGLYSCGGGGQPADVQVSTPVDLRDVRVATLTADAVSSHKDPKGRLSLRDVYSRGSDIPEVFCGSGPRIPTGERMTLFYSFRGSSAESSECRQVFEVVKGNAEWDYEERRVVREDEKIAAERLWADSTHKMQDPLRIPGDGDQRFPNDPTSERA